MAISIFMSRITDRIAYRMRRSLANNWCLAASVCCVSDYVSCCVSGYVSYLPSIHHGYQHVHEKDDRQNSIQDEEQPCKQLMSCCINLLFLIQVSHNIHHVIKHLKYILYSVTSDHWCSFVICSKAWNKANGKNQR